VGTVAEGVAFSNVVTGLSTNMTYFYRCYAENKDGSDWSDTAMSFNGTPAGGTGGGDAWTPSNLTMIAWFDASDTNTITYAFTNLVSQWNDKSGNNRHVTQANTASQPITGARTINGLNVLDFDGADFINKSSSTMLPASGDVAFFMVATVDVINNSADSLYGVSGTTDFQLDAVNATQFNGQINVTGAGVDTSLTGGPFAGPSIYNCNFDYNGLNKYNAFIDGTQRAVNTAYTTKLSTNQTHQIFRNRGGTAQYTDGACAEYIICEDVTTETRQKIEGYLAHKWGLAGNLPSGHPYKANPPGSGGTAIVNLAPSAVQSAGATLNASLGASGTNYAVYAYYGANDGGTNSGSWTRSAYVGSWTNVSTNVSYAVSNLIAGTQYSCTFVASNATGRVWASPSWTFTTLGAAPSVTTNHSVPHAWLSAINTNWSANYEAAVTNDVDGDGFATWQEYWSGTDPQDSNSFLRIDSIGVIGTNLLVSWRHANVDAGIPPITIQSRSNLVSGSWVGIGSHAPTNGVNIWSAGSSVQGFYRLAVTNAP
jgi:hypothetical protein